MRISERSGWTSLIRKSLPFATSIWRQQGLLLDKAPSICDMAEILSTPIHVLMVVTQRWYAQHLWSRPSFGPLICRHVTSCHACKFFYRIALHIGLFHDLGFQSQPRSMLYIPPAISCSPGCHSHVRTAALKKALINQISQIWSCLSESRTSLFALRTKESKLLCNLLKHKSTQELIAIALPIVGAWS